MGPLLLAIPIAAEHLAGMALAGYFATPQGREQLSTAIDETRKAMAEGFSGGSAAVQPCPYAKSQANADAIIQREKDAAKAKAEAEPNWKCRPDLKNRNAASTRLQNLKNAKAKVPRRPIGKRFEPEDLAAAKARNPNASSDSLELIAQSLFSDRIDDEIAAAQSALDDAEAALKKCAQSDLEATREYRDWHRTPKEEFLRQQQQREAIEAARAQRDVLKRAEAQKAQEQVQHRQGRDLSRHLEELAKKKP